MCNCLILLSTYNGEKYLAELLDSVLNQVGVNINILVRDDGSTDNTINILKAYEGEHLNYYLGENKKPAKSFLDLIMSSTDQYDYYALCDQDDVWKPEKILSAIQKIKDIYRPALYSSAVDVVDKNLNFLRKGFCNNTFSNKLYGMITYASPGCTFVFNRLLLMELKKYNPTIISMHDSWISFVCLAVGGYFYSDTNSYILYRQHESNVLGSLRHPLSQTIKNIVNYKGIRRSDMAKEICIGYKEIMSADTKYAFEIFANYKENLKYKLKLLKIKKISGYSKRAFYKIKLRILFNAI